MNLQEAIEFFIRISMHTGLDREHAYELALELMGVRS